MNEFSALQIAILGLATYRTTRLFTRDTILNPIRNWIWKKSPPEKSFIGYLLTCEWCMSVWVGSGFVLSAIIIPEVTYIVATISALSAIAGLLTAYEDK
jgi:hypothetical protein